MVILFMGVFYSVISIHFRYNNALKSSHFFTNMVNFYRAIL
ncbi:hypothetical protein MY1_1331 [Nitrosarchaeum koreense MY1]|uniref:Uncharacterized protein n=1 Tax=Nitrosarchaeum koreense MY1 TaxID=1001994 RepID=F9CXX2_9ARCH|nr:hypothetical protein MY1_1331 [Nitrosarchaeum koreense MY1]